MKPLIRPFLFTVARLGLFLAVVAWIVGQCREIELLRVTDRYRVTLTATGLEIIDTEYPATIVNTALSDLTDSRSTFVEFRVTDGSARYSADFELRKQSLLSHWKLVATLAACNLILQFIYRKRSETEPCRS